MYSLSSNLKINLTHIPHSNASIWIIDNVIDDFDKVLHYCDKIAYFNPVGADGTLFPGMRDEMPKPYYRLLSSLFNRLSEHPQGHIFKQFQIIKSWLSKVTLPPEQLDVIQTMPHFDSLSVNHIAAVHYLNDNCLGGTSFYRYKGIDKLQLAHEDKAVILKMVEEVKQAADVRGGYINETDQFFEKVFSVDAKSNRLIIYASNILHSANITEAVEFDKSSSYNRTTINSFFSVN
ncbi:DUF6445 family protein [Shewanella sp. HL-SH8]|uniref:DUF6445 family protein n=1 Tax=Shewanella sp. HL-SH8 TaxID=3436242 RepID=UPI003EC027A3